MLDDAGQITQVRDFDLDAGSVVDLKVGPDGSLYYLTYFPGQLYKVSYSLAGNAPVVHASSDSTGGLAQPLTVHFSSGRYERIPTATTLQLPLGSSGDGSPASTAANPTKVYAAVGVYPVTLTVSDGASTVASRPIVVQVGSPPVVRIAAPVDGSGYDSGDTITYNAFGNDAAGFDVSDGDIKTEVFLHHNTHVHPFVGPLTGRVGQLHDPGHGRGVGEHLVRGQGDRHRPQRARPGTKSVFIYPRTRRT